MKTIKSLKRALLKAILLIVLLALFFGPRPAQAAWTFTPPQLFWLTNAVPATTNGQFAFNLAAGALTNLPASTITNAGQPFPIVRDRGFSLNIGTWCPTLTTFTNRYVFQFANPYKLYTNATGFIWVTNWNNYGFLTNDFVFAGQTAGVTNELYAWTNNSGVGLQNVTLGRLWEIINPAGGTNFLDPTNTFVAITP